ncbi:MULTISPECIES: signal peptidase II [Oleiagrimonas]|uniref:Lipoprotein signal peptidase n=1 Tax=Oleiagrimonas citrea TaxID=1665687 RepID=A0A846ZGF5_9GAMM|nr:MULTISPECIES: signal peptidase II [Oleiagrimonas]NKZ37774.1 signal peptidase II [Oleiagrimonas citrea]RAP57284.1 signal peptidase II [Oleiagrimonas sp. MCCC 1A03011]
MSKLPKPNALSWLWLTAAVIVLDQLSKYWVLSSIHPGQQVPVISGFWYWTLAFNKGAAFSFLADGSGWQRWFFTGLALVISAVLAVWMARTPRRDWRTALPLALIIGGALGNLIDRLHAGQVTDFVLLYFGRWAYPAFNLADSSIFVGAVLLIGFGMFGGPAHRSK